jgi:regulatory protein YycH of two-component signal transduction system YycFG
MHACDLAEQRLFLAYRACGRELAIDSEHEVDSRVGVDPRWVAFYAGRWMSRPRPPVSSSSAL